VHGPGEVERQDAVALVAANQFGAWAMQKKITKIDMAAK